MTDDTSAAPERLDVDRLAQIIRTVDGSNTLGAGELAERILALLDTPAPTKPAGPAGDALREAIAAQLSEGLGAILRKFCDSPEASKARHYLHAMPRSDWNTLIGMLSEAAAHAALAAAPAARDDGPRGADSGVARNDPR